MDGISERLFPTPQYVSGLLGDEYQAAMQQARQQGLLGLAAGLLQAGGPSRQRIDIGQAIGAGLQAGQQAYRGALSEQIQGQQMAMKLAEQQRLMQQQRALQAAMPTLITTEREQALTTGAQAADPLAALIKSADAGTLNQPVLNQQALSQISALLPPKDFKDLMSALETRVGLIRGPKPEFREVGGALYDVSGGTARQVVAPQNIYGLSDVGKLYGAVSFPGVEPSKYSPEQLGQILQFQQSPTPAALMDLNIKAQTLKAETGIDLTGNVAGLARVIPGIQQVPSQPVVSPAVSPVPSPVAPSAPTAPAAATAPGEPTAAPVQPTAEQLPQFIPQVENPAVPLKFRNELIAAQPKMITASRAAIRDMRDLRDAATKTLNHPGLETATGFLGTPLSSIPGTQARDAVELLNNLKNRSFTAGIVALRQQSPTGSGVGSLTEREGARFENLQANLSQAQSYSQLREQLQQLIRATDETIRGLYDSYQFDFGRNRTIEEDLKRSVISPTGPTRTLPQIFRGK